MRVISTRYRSLHVSGINVRFIDGAAEVSDAEALRVLRGLEHLGVVVPEEDKPKPKKRK